MRMKSMAIAAVLATTLLGTSAYAGPNLVTNGDFSQSSYSANSQFGTGHGGQGVTGWTGNNGYNLYFIGGTDTTVSAASQYTSGKEDLWGPAGGNTSPGGGNFVALDGAQSNGVQGGISQQILGLSIGAQYTLSFDWGAGQLQNRTGATTEQLQVSLGGQTFSTGVLNNPSQSFTGWFNQVFTFTATSTSELLSFLSVGSPVGLPPVATLDDVSLTQVPEPMSIALLGVGLVGLGAAARRRARRAA